MKLRQCLQRLFRPKDAKFISSNEVFRQIFYFRSSSTEIY